MMNLDDEFVQVIDGASSRLELRSDLHFLKLAQGADLWYSGGGAYDNKSFGYTGRPSTGHSSLATLADLSADYNFSSGLILSGYYGYAFGKSVIAGIYPADRNAQYGFFELSYTFSKPLRHAKN